SRRCYAPEDALHASQQSIAMLDRDTGVVRRCSRPCFLALAGSRRCSGKCSAACSSSLLPLPFRTLQPLSHLLVLLAVERPTLCSTVPAVVRDGHVDAAIDEESHRV